MTRIRKKKPKKVITQRGITMTAPLVQLTKEGVKNQTRRLNGLEKVNIAPSRHWLVENNPMDPQWWTFARWTGEPGGASIQFGQKCPFGKVGDYLYLKEAYQVINMDEDGVEYVIKSEAPSPGGLKWIPGRFMPKVAAKTWLQIWNIYPERLSDISEAEIYNEGVVMNDKPIAGWYWMEDVYSTDDARTAWEALFTKLHGKHIIEQDPWVWVIHFKLCDKPELT